MRLEPQIELASSLVTLLIGASGLLFALYIVFSHRRRIR